MTQFMMVYKGEATDMADMSEEEGAAVMAKWATWMEKVGPALSDIGTRSVQRARSSTTGPPGKRYRSPATRSLRPTTWTRHGRWPTVTRTSAKARATTP